MKIEARVRTKEFLPQDNATVNVSVRLPDGTTVLQPAEPSLQEAGLYESTFAARYAGCYRTDVDVVDRDGQPLGHGEAGWVSDSRGRGIQPGGSQPEFSRTDRPQIIGRGRFHQRAG